MREEVAKLCAARRENPANLGSIGGVKFQEIDVFLREKTRRFARYRENPERMNRDMNSLVGKTAKKKNGIWTPSRLRDDIAPVKFNTASDVVAIGDVHGDFLALLSALYLGGVIDKTGKWAGGATIVVQCGDIFDRSGRLVDEMDTSGNVREELDILMYLHGLNEQARLQRGAVIGLTGNHEADQFRHVAEAVQRAGGLENAENDAHFQTITKYEGGQLHVCDGWGGISEKRHMFLQGSDLALYFALFKPLIIQINDFLFCHGGIAPRTGLGQAPRTVEGINDSWRTFLLEPENVLAEDVQDIYYDRTWSKPEATNENSEQCARSIQSIFAEFQLDNDNVPGTPRWGARPKAAMVVAHTVQPEISTFCFGHVIRIDIGLSEAFGEHRPLQVIRILFSKPVAEDAPVIVCILKSEHSQMANSDSDGDGGEQQQYDSVNIKSTCWQGNQKIASDTTKTFMTISPPVHEAKEEDDD